jgi:hypothetical protein
MKSFLKEIERKFMELEESEHCAECGETMADCVCDDEIDEQNVTGAIAGFNTPNAFRKTVKHVDYASGIEESVNTPPSYSLKDERYQRPESEEEEFVDKFPFSENESDWQHKTYEYPSRDLSNTPGTATKKHKTLRVEDVLERKYEQLIEGYRDFKSGDEKPSKKVKKTIQEIAKKLHEIETLVNYNSRLKTESGVTSDAYGPGTTKALTKISERLIKISERIRSLGE